MLNLIDNLPGNSLFSEAMSQDEEYMQQLLAVYGGNLPEGDKHPRLRDWSPEVEKLARVIEQLSGIASILIAANSGKNGKAPKPETELRPRNALQALRKKTRLAKHAALASRIVRRDTEPGSTD